jgi:hypothetical protein
LAALGAKVTAIEEVKKYAHVVEYMSHAFGIEDKLKIIADSLYNFNNSAVKERFDIIWMPGVAYHLSDPVLALRIMFNACRIGGEIFVETKGIDSEDAYCRFEGSRVFGGGSKDLLNRSGWNWFVPSALALSRWVEEAGFDNVRSVYMQGRVYAYAKKTSYKPMCKAGLSVTQID